MLTIYLCFAIFLEFYQIILIGSLVLYEIIWNTSLDRGLVLMGKFNKHKLFSMLSQNWLYFLLHNILNLYILQNIQHFVGPLFLPPGLCLICRTVKWVTFSDNGIFIATLGTGANNWIMISCKKRKMWYWHQSYTCELCGNLGLLVISLKELAFCTTYIIFGVYLDYEIVRQHDSHLPYECCIPGPFGVS